MKISVIIVINYVFVENKNYFFPVWVLNYYAPSLALFSLKVKVIKLLFLLKS